MIRTKLAAYQMVLAAFFLSATCVPSDAAETKVDLQTRPGNVQPVVFIPATQPVGGVILFPGGNGVISRVQGNFLLRVADRFAAGGYNVAILDSPSDHPNGMGTPFRIGEAHARDISAVATFLRGKTPGPVWAIGTSRGSISAANAGARLGPATISGIVLTSSVWGSGMEGVPLGQIAVPTLVIHNRDDGCSEAPFAGTTGAMAQLTKAPAKELIAVEGGNGPGRGDPCGAGAAHGFQGLESSVVKQTLAWMAAHDRK